MAATRFAVLESPVVTPDEDAPMASRNGPKLSRAELKAQADAALAAFRNQGGAVKQMPTVEPTNFACPTCGHTGVIGAREGQAIRCPKCRTLIR